MEKFSWNYIKGDTYFRILDILEDKNLTGLEESVELVSAKEQQKVYGIKEEETLEDLLDDVKELLNNLEKGSKKEDEALDLLEDSFGGLSLSELTNKHIPALKVFINDLEDIIND